MTSVNHPNMLLNKNSLSEERTYNMVVIKAAVSGLIQLAVDQEVSPMKIS